MKEHSFKHMLNKTYLFNTEQYTIGDIIPLEDGKFSIITDRRALKVSENQLKKDFLPVSLPSNGHSNALALSVKKELEPLSSLLSTLQDNIEKVKKDPKYIPQAKEINDQVKSAISLGKLHIEVLKLTRSK